MVQKLQKEILMAKQQPSTSNVQILESSDRIAAETRQIEEQIRLRAYLISEGHGQTGREVDDWLTAESELVLAPPAEVLEASDSLTVNLAVPGLPADQVQILAARDQMLIKGAGPQDAGATLLRRLDLPQAIDPRTVRVESSNGMLQVTARKEAAVSALSSAKTPKAAPENREVSANAPGDKPKRAAKQNTPKSSARSGRSK
jgi:HSP20 family molecular chaperone IbpA